MKLTFVGAAHQVTGSCFLLEADGKKILIDCGMEQGPDLFEKQSLPFFVPEIDFVLLTHAHIDHSGLIPLLYAQGFRGVIYTTSATKQLCDIMLKDSAHIQEMETTWKNTRSKRSDGMVIEPLYTMQDAVDVMAHFGSHEYRESFYLTGNIKVRFLDAGHLLGSSHIEIQITENDVTKTIVFSGDIGNNNRPLINNHADIEYADYIVMESTYGDRLHSERNDGVEELAEIIQNTFDMGGKLIIPAFAVGRTQELLYFIRQIKERKLVKGYGDFTVYLDSPLAIEATNIFTNMSSEYYDRETSSLLKRGVNPVGFSGLKLSVTSEDSRLINEQEGPYVVISASGMCEAGRIRHHLKHNAWDKKNTILFAGYQVPGTLGHAILSGATKVKLFMEEISVNARVMKLESSSAHADKQGLLDWLKPLKNTPQKIFVVHGDDRTSEMFAETIKSELGYDAVAPFFGEQYDLELNVKIKNGVKRSTKKVTEKATPHNTVFKKLLGALRRLQTVVLGSEKMQNKDIERFTKQIDELSNRWEKGKTNGNKHNK